MKIICSDGPRIESVEQLQDLYKAGMNVIRFNFSHADYDRIAYFIKYCRENCPDLLILQDLQGVKIRVARNYHHERKVFPGQKVIFGSEELYDGESHLMVPVHIDGDFKSLMSAHKIYMKDATMEFNIVEKREQEQWIIAEVVKGGVIRARKAINAPGMDRSNIDLTEKDRSDILWGLEHQVDIICLSFVCQSIQIKNMKKFIQRNLPKKQQYPIIWAKIETQEGVDNFASIRRCSDGIMLGRGDLGPEVGLVEVPEIQDDLLKKVKKSKQQKDFVVATQVLSSMAYTSTPSRAELNDIYQCLKHNVTGFMLCSEIGIGRFPLETIEVMKSMIARYHDKD